VELFVSLPGTLAGNLALKYLSKGGVYLGGGIAPKIVPLLQEGSFMQAFLAKVGSKVSLRNLCESGDG
jgi:glucokinase